MWFLLQYCQSGFCKDYRSAGWDIVCLQCRRQSLPKRQSKLLSQFKGREQSRRNNWDFQESSTWLLQLGLAQMFSGHWINVTRLLEEHPEPPRFEFFWCNQGEFHRSILSTSITMSLLALTLHCICRTSGCQVACWKPEGDFECILGSVVWLGAWLRHIQGK